MGEKPGEAELASGALRRAVMAEILAETLDLMNQMERLAGARSEARRDGSPMAAALVLRMSTRLAAVGSWVLVQEDALDDASDDAQEPLDPRDAAAERARRSEILDRAEFGPLDPRFESDPLAKMSARIDRLVARARRLDRLAGESAPGAAARQGALYDAARIFCAT